VAVEKLPFHPKLPEFWGLLKNSFQRNSQKNEIAPGCFAKLKISGLASDRASVTET